MNKQQYKKNILMNPAHWIKITNYENETWFTYINKTADVMIAPFSGDSILCANFISGFENNSENFHIKSKEVKISRPINWDNFYNYLSVLADPIANNFYTSYIENSKIDVNKFFQQVHNTAKEFEIKHHTEEYTQEEWWKLFKKTFRRQHMSAKSGITAKQARS